MKDATLVRAEVPMGFLTILATGFLAGAICFIYVIISYFGVYERWAYFNGYFEPVLAPDVLLLGLLTCGIVGAFIGLQAGRFSKFGLVAIAFFTLIPGLAISSLSGDTGIFFNVVFSTLTFLVIFTLVNGTNWSVISTEVSPQLRSQLQLIALASVPILFIVFTTFEVKRLNIDVLDVYELRSEMRAESGNRIAAYAYGISAKLLVGSLAALAGIRRSLTLLALAVGLAIAIFLIGGQKSVLGFAFLSGIIGLSHARLYEVRGETALACLGLLACLMYGISEMLNSFLIHDIFLRRIVHVPGVLIYHYFGLFGGNPNALSYASVPAGEIPFLVGHEFFGRGEMRANVNGYAASFAQLGHYGVVFFTLAYALTIKYANDAAARASGHTRGFMLALFISYLWALSESAITTVYVTHGLGMYLAIVWLSSSMQPREKI